MQRNLIRLMAATCAVAGLSTAAAQEIDSAAQILAAAMQAQWAPISFDGKLQDRASYRYYWQVLERAHRTGRALPGEALAWFQGATTHSTETSAV